MSKTQAKTIADFRAAHDPNVIVPAKIKKALDELEKAGTENWSYESDFIKLAGISQTQIAMFRDQFADHVIETGGRVSKRVWFASTKVAAKVR